MRHRVEPVREAPRRPAINRDEVPTLPATPPVGGGGTREGGQERDSSRAAREAYREMGPGPLGGELDDIGGASLQQLTS